MGGNHVTVVCPQGTSGVGIEAITWGLWGAGVWSTLFGWGPRLEHTPPGDWAQKCGGNLGIKGCGPARSSKGRLGGGAAGLAPQSASVLLRGP